MRWPSARAITPKENTYLTLTSMCYTLMSRSNKYKKYIPQQQNSHVLIIFSYATLQTFWQCVCSVWLKTFDELTKKRRILHFCVLDGFFHDSNSVLQLIDGWEKSKRLIKEFRLKREYKDQICKIYMVWTVKKMSCVERKREVIVKKEFHNECIINNCTLSIYWPAV